MLEFIQIARPGETLTIQHCCDLSTPSLFYTLLLPPFRNRSDVSSASHQLLKQSNAANSMALSWLDLTQNRAELDRLGPPHVLPFRVQLVLNLKTHLNLESSSLKTIIIKFKYQKSSMIIQLLWFMLYFLNERYNHCKTSEDIIYWIWI